MPCAHHHAEKSNDKLNSIITHTCTRAIGNPAGLAIVWGGARWPARTPIGPPPPADQCWAEILAQSGASVGQKSAAGGVGAKEACSSLETMWSGQDLQGVATHAEHHHHHHHRQPLSAPPSLLSSLPHSLSASHPRCATDEDFYRRGFRPSSGASGPAREGRRWEGLKRRWTPHES